MKRRIHLRLFIFITLFPGIFGQSSSENPSNNHTIHKTPDVNVMCHQDAVEVEFPDVKPFTGVFYIEGQYNNSMCKKNFRNVENPKFLVPHNPCAPLHGNRVSFNIIINKNSKVIDEKSLNYRIQCFYKINDNNNSQNDQSDNNNDELMQRDEFDIRDFIIKKLIKIFTPNPHIDNGAPESNGDHNNGDNDNHRNDDNINNSNDDNNNKDYDSTNNDNNNNDGNYYTNEINTNAHLVQNLPRSNGFCNCQLGELFNIIKSIFKRP